MKIDRPTRLELVGRGKITLKQSDHVATGGEGSVYLLGKTIVKLYADPNKMLQDDMPGKIKLLATFQHPYIVAPQNIVLDSLGRPVGFYMDYAEGEPLARMFTNKFRKRTGFGDNDASTLADRMLEVFRFAHDRKAVLVDPNELNWVTILGNTRDPEPRILDVDSWAIGRWPPRAVMLSIRDFHTKGFTTLTDMFAWGIVTFQLYTGIHPYKGELAGYGMSELERRMRDNASVFSKGTMLPLAVRDFGCIPGPLLGWYEATFQDGERTTPPSPFAAGVTVPARQVKVTRIVTTASGSLRYQRLLDNSDPAMRVFPCGVALLESGALYDLASRRRIGSVRSRNCEVIRVNGGWVVGEPNGHVTKFTFVNGTNFVSEQLDTPVQGTGMIRYENRLFLVTHGGITELHFRKFGARPVLASGSTFGTIPKATEWFDGVGVLDALGNKILVAPFGSDSCEQIPARELHGLRVVAAKAGHRFIRVIALNAAGQHEQFDYVLDRAYKHPSVTKTIVQDAELNLALVPRGEGGVVGASVVRDGELIVFAPTSNTVNTVADKDVATTMILANWETQVVFIRDGQIWSLTMS